MNSQDLISVELSTFQNKSHNQKVSNSHDKEIINFQNNYLKQEETSNLSRFRNDSPQYNHNNKGAPEHDPELNSPNQEKNLPSTDGGFLAWRFVLIAFLADGIIWGVPQCFGVFLDFPPYSQMSPTVAAVIGTLCTGLLYCVGSVVTPLMERHMICGVIFPPAGTLICSASLLAASYSTKEWQLLSFQGIIYGIGGGLLYYPALFFLAEWWVVRRGFAGAIMFAGSSCFDIIIPPMLDWALKKYGSAKTLRGLGVTFLLGMAPVLPFFRGRLLLSSRKYGSQVISRNYLQRPIFWVFMLLNFLQSLAFFVPNLFMPTYATSIGSPGGIVLTLFSASTIIGQIITGALSDYVDLGWIIGVTSITSSISIFFLWGRSEGFVMLAAFAVVYGISAGGFSCLWQRFAMVVAPSDPNSGSLVVHFATCRGIANILTGPIAGFLIQNSSSKKEGYKALVYYSGSLMMICTIGAAVRLLHQRN